MHAHTVRNRLLDRIERAKSAIISEGVRAREAARTYHVLKSTLHDSVQRHRKNIALKKAIGRRAFTTQEEDVIVQTSERFADHGIPISRQQTKEAIIMFT